MKFIRKHWMILAILLIASVLRLWQLGNIPPSPDWDEAALGYNAYSILKTGRDEYGTFLPLSLRSFDDYKPPLYMYLTVPSVAVFGLNVWSTRLPSAIMGVLSVFGTYLLIRELIEDKDTKRKRYLPLIGALLLAISPWHIQFSRIAFEANIGVSLNIWVLYFFFLSLRKPWWVAATAVLSGLGLYAYHSERIFLPLILLILGGIYRKHLWKYKKQFGMALVLGAITVAPLVPVTFNKTALTRLQGTSSLADQTGLLARSVLKLERDQKVGDKFGELFDNRRLVWVQTLANGYLSHYSIKWLFLTGDNPRHHAPDMGLMYLFELPFWFYGMYLVFKRGGKIALFLFGWFFVVPIAASPTTELPHAIRTLNFLPVMQIFTAFGMYEICSKFKVKSSKFNLKYLFIIFYSLFIILNIIFYLHMYFGHMNREFSQSWQYGYKQAVEYAEEHKGEYTKIVVSIKLEQPHMFFLFYTAYDPKKYLTEGGTSSGGFEEIRNAFDIYEFRSIHWDSENHDGSTLYIGTPKEIPAANKEKIDYLDGTPAILIGT